MKKTQWILGVLIAGLVAATPVLAAEFIVPGQSDPNIDLASGQSKRNLYTAGANVNIQSNTLGDLVVAGSVVDLSGNVEQDLFAAAGTLNVRGSVGGDARVAGGNVTISGPVAGDLILGGGNVIIAESASIGGDLVLGSGNVKINGPVKGSVMVGGGNVVVNSKIEGSIRAQVSQNLVFGPRADVAGKVSYKAPKEAEFQQGSNVPNHEFNKLTNRKAERGFKGILTIAFLIKFVAWLIAGFLLIYFRKQWFYSVAEEVHSRPWASLGLGFAGVVLTPIALVIVLVTVVGYYVALLGFLSYLLVLAVANLLAALIVGYLILKALSKPGETTADWQVVLLGVVVWFILQFIPILGWLAMAVVFFMAAGVVVRKTSGFFRRAPQP